MFYFVTSDMKIIGHGNADNNLESPCIIPTYAPMRSQEQEQHKDQRPHDKKYTTHSKAKQIQSRRHIQEAHKN
jgi:hypothetical protein